MKQPIIVAKNVHKKIDSISILKDLSFQIDKGEKVAITGHNGSGKSSLLKLAAGIYGCDAGEWKVDTNSIAYVPEHFPEHIRFRLQEYLLLLGKMAGKEESDLKEKILAYAERLELIPFLNQPLRKCSKGTKQKAGILQALLVESELLLLDEPLSGLDETSQKELLTIFKEEKERRTILFTAHEQDTVELLADRVIHLENGRILSDSMMREKQKVFFVLAEIPPGWKDSKFDTCHQENNKIFCDVREDEKDKLLMNLLESGCSILEVKEKK
ncbi:ATP-binding cassette domain-containing protein [Peribacillus tepidiphilus]|uniref:ATP-binding cassette domain-containing protein n=1 Tax=Peribacillus tepidiphilus TaxID=2652445 RepID=UPI00129272FA|nr:ATP-binding cassette domain-containing protein [Peribacillus tepidiphilus]